MLVALTVGVGLTVTVTVVDEVHDPAVAIIVKVVDCWVFVVFVKEPVIEEPDPLAGIPVRLVVLVLVQLNVVPLTLFGFVILI